MVVRLRVSKRTKMADISSTFLNKEISTDGQSKIRAPNFGVFNNNNYSN